MRTKGKHSLQWHDSAHENQRFINRCMYSIPYNNHHFQVVYQGLRTAGQCLVVKPKPNSQIWRGACRASPTCDISRFPPLIDTIFPGEALNPLVLKMKDFGILSYTTAFSFFTLNKLTYQFQGKGSYSKPYTLNPKHQICPKP